MFVLKSRTETDARKKVSVIFVLISRTNFSRKFGVHPSDGTVEMGTDYISCCLMDSSVIKREAMSDRGRGGLCGSATRQGIPGRRLIETMVRVGVVLGVQLPPKQIGSIDLHMPEKTHAEISQFCLQTSTS
jgi:hypothetical protein